MAKGIKRKLYKVLDKIEREIAISARGSVFAAGLSGEGYRGGYRAALNDVILALNGNTPYRRGWWEEDDEESDVANPGEPW